MHPQPSPGLGWWLWQGRACQGVPAFPGHLAAPLSPFWLHPRLSQQDNGKIPPRAPNSPAKEPPGCPHTVLLLLEMDSGGFRERCQCGQGHRDSTSCMRSTRSLPAQILISLSLGESLHSSPDPTQVPQPPHLLANVQLKTLPGFSCSS